jgi:hypothetical protein
MKKYKRIELFEISNNDFIKLWNNSKVKKKYDIEYEVDASLDSYSIAGACDLVSDLYVKNNPGSLVIVAHQISNKFGWADIHVAILKNNKIIDFTFRQFKNNSKIPEIFKIIDWIKFLEPRYIGVAKTFSKAYDKYIEINDFINSLKK